jgi:hypothetical protein
MENARKGTYWAWSSAREGCEVAARNVAKPGVTLRAAVARSPQRLGKAGLRERLIDGPGWGTIPYAFEYCAPPLTTVRRRS